MLNRPVPRPMPSYSSWWLSVPEPQARLDAALHLPKFETIDDVNARLLRLSDTLCRSEQTWRLGEHLLTCFDGSGCGLSICPRCVRILRRNFLIPQIVEILRSGGNKRCRPAVAISTVIDDLATPVSDIGRFSPERALERFRKRLRRQGFDGDTAMTGLDYSYNVSSNGSYASHFMPHFYSILLTDVSIEELRGQLSESLVATVRTPRPLLIRVIQDPFQAASYIFKPYFAQRISYRARNGRMATREISLPPAVQRELSLHVAYLSPTDRLGFVGARRRGHQLVET